MAIRFSGRVPQFESRAIDRFDLSGMILGGDFDVVKLDWLALGAAVDFYFIDPNLSWTGFYHFFVSCSASNCGFKGRQADPVGRVHAVHSAGDPRMADAL